MNYSLLDLSAILRSISRGVVFYAPTRWDGLTDLALTHLGDTEGEITVAFNEAYSDLTFPEITGPAKHARYVDGEDPVVSIPLFYADPALRAICSPTGNASGGYERRRPVTERTLVIFPEELFFDEAGSRTYETLAFTGNPGSWTLGGVALTSRQEELLGLAIWFWRGHFTKPGAVFKHDLKDVQTVNFQVLQTDVPLAKIPDGERLYTLGDPADKGINIEPVVA